MKLHSAVTLAGCVLLLLTVYASMFYLAGYRGGQDGSTLDGFVVWTWSGIVAAIILLILGVGMVLGRVAESEGL